MNLINKYNSLLDSPEVSENWKSLNEKDRIEKIKKFLAQNINNIQYDVIKASADGQVTIKINQSIPASKRGLIEGSFPRNSLYASAGSFVFPALSTNSTNRSATSLLKGLPFSLNAFQAS